ncbi:hypothetical protein ACIQVK_18785 [Streptomyces sp. NPDC090493]|uniref:hypothetical protein n=1 Tax=Streptomyces sp. NPDC090493 TaxID=3365964 RepID=UPI0037F9375F
MTQTQAKAPIRVKLGERRTVLTEVPDSRPIVDESIYEMTHELCVPGGWESIATTKTCAPRNLAGVYGPSGQMLEHTTLRRLAGNLFDLATKRLNKHPYGRLSELVSKMQPQEGTGEVGGWDDPGVCVEMADLLSNLVV